MLTDIQHIKEKSVSGIMALLSRSIVLQVIAFISTFILTILLSPEIFGIFYVVSAVIGFLNYFSDVGLAAALIQKHDDVSDQDLISTFTIQEILVVCMSTLMFIAAPHIAHFYNLDGSGLLLLRSLVIAFFLSSLKTIPSIILERKLEFNLFVIPQIAETLAFYSMAIIFAWMGWGVTSFSVAVIVRAVVGLGTLWIVSPWRIRIGIYPGSAKRLLKFGIPFQMNSFLALLKDDLMTIFLGKVLSLESIGYIGWAKKWAELPLRLVMDNVIRITFPVFSRLQHSKDIMAKGIEKTIFGLSLAIFPISSAMIFFMPVLLRLIPKYSKWEPALLSFVIFVLASVNAGLSTPLTNALNAIGKIKITLTFMSVWVVLTWVMTVFAVNMIGFNGFAVSLYIITWSIIAVVHVMKYFIPFQFFRSIRAPISGVIIQTAVYAAFQVWTFQEWVSVLVVGGAGGILYVLVVYMTDKNQIISLIKDFYAAKKS